jgi:hypothetical protein
MNRGRPGASPVAFLALALSLACGASSGEPRVPPDESLTPHQYQELGFPRLAANWTEDDRTKARGVLRSLAEDRPEQLPRFASESSGAVFAKLIHEEFDRRGDFEGEVGPVPVGELEQMEPDELAQLIQGDTLEGIYAPESTGGLLFDRELVQFASQRLAGAVAIRSDLQANLAEVEASPTRGQDFAARYRELLEFNDRMLVQLLANIAAFAGAERFTPVARSDAVSHLAEQVPLIAPLLSSEARAKLREAIREASASPGADPRLDVISRQL